MDSVAITKKVLVIDDNRAVCSFVSKTLEAHGFSVAAAEGGDSGIASAQDSRPDLILIDYKLGGGELGTAVCEKLAAVEGLSQVPIVLMAARGGALPPVENATLAEVLEKPFSREALVAVARKLLGVLDPPPVSDGGAEKEVARAGRDGPPSDPRSLLLRKLEQRLANSLRESVLSAIQEGGDLDREQLAKSIAERVLHGEFLHRLAEDLHDVMVNSPQEGFAASSRTIGLADLLQSLANNQLTGVLAILSPENAVELHLFNGRVRFFNPRRIALRFSTETVYCNSYAFPVAVLRETLTQSEEDDGSLFFRLLERGLLEPEDLCETMVALGSEVLGECVAAQEACWYHFRPRQVLTPRFLEYSTDLPVQRLMLKMYSQIDEWRAMEKEVSQRGAVFAPAAEDIAARSDSLGPLERRLLEALDGERDFLQVAAFAQESPVTVCRTLFRLEQKGLVRRMVEARLAAGDRRLALEES